MSGLFGSFNIAKSGMYVQQRNIDVTSHNISNVHTPGYSRQRVEVTTNRAYSTPKGEVGTGAQVEAIERVRDTFLDYQVRNETANLGKYDIRNKFLYETESIFNEPSDTGISHLMGKFFDSWQELSKQPNSSNARTVVAQQTEALTNALNHTYTKLEQLQSNGQDLIRTSVKEVNNLLNQLDSVNQEIINVSVSGNTPNDLLDKRDLLVDELSYKFNISVEYDSFNGINIKPEDANGMKAPNIVTSSPNGQVARFSYVSDIKAIDQSGTYEITYYKNGDMSSESNKQTLKVTGMSKEQVKELEQNRIIWANRDGEAIKGDGYAIKNGGSIHASELMGFKPESGVLSGITSVQKDIQNYMDQLNKMAKAVAFSVNAVHSGMTDAFDPNGAVTRDSMPLFVNKDMAKYDKNGILINVDETLWAESEITAKNISINKEILEDVMKIKTKTNDWQFEYTSQNDIDGDGDGARALAIAKLRDTMLRIQDINETVISRGDLFSSNRGGASLTNSGMTIESVSSGIKVDSYYKDIVDKLGIQAQEAKRMLANQEELLFSLEDNKAQVSSVSLDEEMANLVQFQHAYNASAKVIATIDELLDVVVNGLKR